MIISSFSICKGPEWKPGIFVQFTKEGGIARDAGLRPGDQILFCNNVDFSDIPFNEVIKYSFYDDRGSFKCFLGITNRNIKLMFVTNCCQSYFTIQTL